MHARRVIPDEEWLTSLRRIVAIEEVDDLGRNLFVNGLRPLQGQRTFVLTSSDSLLSRLRMRTRVRAWEASDMSSSSDQRRRELRPSPGIGVFLQGGATACSVGDLLMSGKLTCCMASR